MYRTAVEKPKSHTQGQGEDSCHGPQTILRKQRKSFDVVKIAQEQAADLEGAEKEGWLRWLQNNKHKSYFQSCKEFIDAARAHVGESCSMPSSAVGSVGNDKGAVYCCFLFIPPSVAWAAGLSRWGSPPLNPGRPPERAGESTRTPLISPEKLALPRPARGAPLASSLAGSFRGTGGQWEPYPRTSPCAPVWPTSSACSFFCL